MQELLTLIVTWLVINFGLPAIEEPPHVKFVPSARIAQIRVARLESASADGAAIGTARAHAPPEAFQEVYAFYDDRSRTIYLPEQWATSSPADVSMLVHETVHHLQNVGGLKYGCPEAREEQAYHAQSRWLELFGSTLADEFAVDAVTILLRTRCMH